MSYDYIAARCRVHESIGLDPDEALDVALVEAERAIANHTFTTPRTYVEVLRGAYPDAVACDPAPWPCRHQCGECRLGLGVHLRCDPLCSAR